MLQILSTTNGNIGDAHCNFGPLYYSLALCAPTFGDQIDYMTGWNSTLEANNTNLSMEMEIEELADLERPWGSVNRMKSSVVPLSPLPSELTEVGFIGWLRILGYVVVFLVSGTGNLWEFKSVRKRAQVMPSPVNRLLLHLCIADIIVVIMVAGVEILWRISIGWYGGDVLCKVVQFFRAFGLYLSSLVLICISLDRYYAVVHPLKVVSAPRRVTIMLITSWVTALICSVPQSIIFREEVHPKYPLFRQCASMWFPEGEWYNTWLSLSVMYYIPLLVIVFSYGFILHVVSSEVGNPVPRNGHLFLRRNGNGHCIFKKAKLKTLKLTFFIVFVFILCWTPYVVMSTWYMVDPNSAEQVNGHLQEILFLMVVANSSANPLVYGVFNRRETKTVTFHESSRDGDRMTSNKNHPCTSHVDLVDGGNSIYTSNYTKCTRHRHCRRQEHKNSRTRTLSSHFTTEV